MTGACNDCRPSQPAAYGTGMLRAKAIAPPHLRSTTTAMFFALYYVGGESLKLRLLLRAAQLCVRVRFGTGAPVREACPRTAGLQAQ